jgi:hypothetical protein
MIVFLQIVQHMHGEEEYIHNFGEIIISVDGFL